jgi:hypothetical protein
MVLRSTWYEGHAIPLKSLHVIGSNWTRMPTIPRAATGSREQIYYSSFVKRNSNTAVKISEHAEERRL